MKNKSKIKLIILVFLIILFLMLFWFFYNPSSESKKAGKKITDDWGINFFGDEKIKEEKEEKNTHKNKKREEYPWEVEIPKLRQISKIPTAGVYFQKLNTEELHKMNVKNNVFGTEKALNLEDRISEIRYVAMSNGYIYSTFTNILESKKITNTIIPKIYTADFWDKENFIIQYVDDLESNNPKIRTYSVKLSEKSAEERIVEQILNQDKAIEVNQDILKFSGVFLPANIEDYSILPNSKYIFYLLKKDGKTKGYRADAFGENKTQIFSSELNEWNINWKNQNHILLNNKPSAKSYTLFFDLNAKTGYKRKILDAALAGNGLPNYSFSKILYSAKDTDSKFYLWSEDLNSGEKQKIYLTTFVDKCVWSKNNFIVFCAVPRDGIGDNEPDLWYKGYVDSDDLFYVINTKTGETEQVFDPFDYGQDFDAIKLKIDDYEDYLYFIDSKTNFAWSYKLDNNYFKSKIQQNDNQKVKILGGGKLCPSDQILHENLKAGDRNGKYSAWAKKKITEVKILQAHMNRLGFGAGKIDGILGKQSDASIKRMQKKLGTYQDGKVGPITRNLINHSCE